VSRDPLADPAPLVRRVYAYVAYRLGDGAEAEDATSEVFERALRYRRSYDESRGEPIQWLLGIAHRCVNDALSSRRSATAAAEHEVGTRDDHAGEVIDRLTLAEAIETLDERSRDLVALRYDADLTARQIGRVLGLKTNAVEVALHRALGRLRGELDREEPRPVPLATKPFPEPPR
jgi:RNA polymerase sigma factor (sigma-70 family)